jgi:Cu+-exporting ATPase
MASLEHNHTHDHSGQGSTARDPVCGMNVDKSTAKHRYELDGTTHYFCNPRCLEKFVADPQRYLSPDKADETADAPEGTIWTCPMHPQIRQDYPGSCPICGMALEPLEPTAEEGPNPELIDMTRRFWISAALTLPILVLVMGDELFGLGLVPMRTSVWIQLALSTPVVLWAGWPFFERFWASLKTRNLNMFTLIGLGVGAGYGYSLVAAIFPGIFPPSLRTMGGMVPVYFEASAVITTLVLLGQVLELRARAATGKEIRSLLGLVPKTARRVSVG